MKSISSILEAKKNDEPALLKDEMDRYIKAMSPIIKDKKVQACLYILSKYPQISTKDEILAVRDGQFRMLDKAGILPDDLKDLQKLLRQLGDNIKLLPHFLNEHQRQALEQKKLSVEDVTLDITTKAGREKTAKQYAPLVFKIARQYENKSSLSYEELVSAGYEGLARAMNEYKTSEELEVDGKKGTQTFAQYAAYRIKFAILDEINDNGNTVYQSDYMRNKEGAISTSSIDGTYGKDEDGDDIKIDRLLDLSEEPADIDSKDRDKTRRETNKALLKKLESKFSSRDCDIFCRYMGICDYDGQSQEGKAIARHYMITPAAVSQKVQAIVKWIKADKESLNALRRLIGEAIMDRMSKTIDAGKAAIFEALVTDDLYILFESLNRWPNKKGFQDAVDKATDPLSVDDALFIFNCMRIGKEFLDKNFKKYKPVIVAFLNNIYPAENFKRSSDDELMERMFELIDYSTEYKIKW